MSDKTSWTFPIAPVPAARPRMGRYGTYYPKVYETFRRTAQAVVRKIIGERWKPLACALVLDVTFLREQPKKTSRDYPKGDVDNYSKSIMDSLNEVAWVDDDQITTLIARKRWAPKGCEGTIIVSLAPDKDFNGPDQA